MKQIRVQNKDFGFWTEQPITVVIHENSEDDSIAFCNHAGAEANTHTSQYYSPAKEDVVDVEHVIDECDKCGAIRYRFDDEWINAPMEGVH